MESCMLIAVYNREANSYISFANSWKHLNSPHHENGWFDWSARSSNGAFLDFFFLLFFTCTMAALSKYINLKGIVLTAAGFVRRKACGITLQGSGVRKRGSIWNSKRHCDIIQQGIWDHHISPKINMYAVYCCLLPGVKWRKRKIARNREGLKGRMGNKNTRRKNVTEIEAQKKEKVQRKIHA